MDEESQNAQDIRIETLWKSLHDGPVEPLDLTGLRAGLRKIGHPLAGTDKLLEQVFAVVDTSKDGKIEYSEFRVFIEHTETELRKLFKSIDKNHNGRLDKLELHEAFRNADIVTDESKLDRFFDHIDRNHDGEITFEEWRNFLMFLPLDTPNLHSLLSYYNNTIFVGSEGDVTVHAGQGLGIDNILYTLFGSLFDLAQYRPPHFQSLSSSTNLSTLGASSSSRSDLPWDPGDEIRMADSIASTVAELPEHETLQQMLTSVLPQPGYFVSGGLAGLFSRTATAPLDRLKVYLIAQTGARKEAMQAVKSGSPAQVMQASVRPLYLAYMELWHMGGIKSLFSGNGLNVLKVMPESAMKFGSYEACKKIGARLEGHTDTKNLTFFHQFMSAGTSGSIAQFVVYPLDTLKFRVQCETVADGPRGNALILQTARKMFREGGFRAYWRGLALGMGGMFPYSAIDLSTYEYLKKKHIEWKVSKTGCSEIDGEPKGFTTGIIGAMSSSFGASLVYPVNLIRTRMQSQGTVVHPPTYNGWQDCLNKTLQKDGVKGLYKGLTPNLIKVMPAMSITYMVYETCKSTLGLKG